MRSLIFSLLATVLLIGCSSDETSTTNVDFMVVSSGWNATTSYDELASFVINSEEQYLNFLNSNLGVPVVEIADVDYTNYTLLAVVDKTRPDNSYGATIYKVYETPSTVEVVVKLTKHDGMATQQPVAPYCIAKVNKINKQVNWQYINE
ncbi:MAG: hypothetical protein Q4B43_06710 [Bacteroidota bacterium]|nr:hypothetical protein [Bacteroidota bacterium]